MRVKNSKQFKAHNNHLELSKSSRKEKEEGHYHSTTGISVRQTKIGLLR